MKSQTKSKAIKMIEKFDNQLRALLTEEIKLMKSGKVISIQKNNDLLVA